MTTTAYVERLCDHCEEPLRRHVYPYHAETTQYFQARRHCDRRCAAAARAYGAVPALAAIAPTIPEPPSAALPAACEKCGAPPPFLQRDATTYGRHGLWACLRCGWHRYDPSP